MSPQKTSITAGAAKANPPAQPRARPAAPDKSGAAGPVAGAAPLGRDGELKAYRDMLLIRRFEERAGQLYGMGLIGGFCHLYIGQEAVVVGMQMAIGEGDQVITGPFANVRSLADGQQIKLNEQDTRQTTSSAALTRHVETVS